MTQMLLFGSKMHLFPKIVHTKLLRSSCPVCVLWKTKYASWFGSL